MSSFDIKVGYACNNHCRHCVIEDNKPGLIKIGESLDSSYAEIVGIMQSKEFIEASQIVITGGEPTLRKEFSRIIGYIVKNYPEKNIAIQTNGRLLGKYLEEFNRMSNKIFYVIAVHGTEETHNLVTNNPTVSDTNNPFKETMNSLRVLKEVYSDFSSVARIEIVLSKLNLHSIVDCIKMLLDEGYYRIGISYPHLDGMFMARPEEAYNLGFSYEELKPVLVDMYELVKNYERASLTLEEVPICMFRFDSVDKDTVILSDKLISIGHNIPKTHVKFPGRSIDNSFDTSYTRAHKFSSECSRCTEFKNKSCLGTWFESMDMFGSQGFIPITSSTKIINEK